MTITFESKQNGKIIKVKDVKYFTTESECLGKKGYGVNYEDGTFSLYPYKEWILVMVKQ